jgi:hypothetical protein
MKLLCVLCALCGIQSFALDREAFTFTNYDLDVRVEPEQQRLAARGKLTLRNDSASAQKNLVLQISSTLDWRSIQLDRNPVQFVSQPYTSDIDHTGSVSEAIVTLPQPIPPKATLELAIGYEGTIPLATTRLARIGVPEEVAKHTDWDQIGKSFTGVRGIGYVAWYPIAVESANLSEGNSIFAAAGRWKRREAEASMKIHLQAPLLAAEAPTPSIRCSGLTMYTVTRGGSPKFAAADCTYVPMKFVVPAFVIAGYDFLDRPTAQIYYLPDHRDAAENYALAADLALPFITEWFGHPREKVQLLELADRDTAPFESGAIVLTPLGKNDSALSRLTAVHQLTHAAFVSPRPWIYEGVAHFMQAAYKEQDNGRQAALDFMGLHRTAVADAEKALATEHGQNAAADESLINTSREEFYRSKAMYVWWMLRNMVGEPPLKKALALYHPEQDKEPSYIEHLIEVQAKRDLEWFFDDWVYRDRGLPDFRVQSAYPRPIVGGGFVVTITIENLGSAGAEVPVTLRMEGGEVTKRVKVAANSTGTVRIEAPSPPQEVLVNDGSVPESNLSNNKFTIQK